MTENGILIGGLQDLVRVYVLGVEGEEGRVRMGGEGGGGIMMVLNV